MDYRTMVNSTYLTAKSTLHVLAAMGNTGAKDMMTALGTQDTLTRRTPKNPQTFLSEEDAKAISGDNVVYQVVDSYKSLMDLVMK